MHAALGRGGSPLLRVPAEKSEGMIVGKGVFSSNFYDTLRYASKVSEPPPRYIMTGGACLAISDTHRHHTDSKI